MRDNLQDTLIVVTGPTASGKTALAIDLARALDTEIVSADSRQVFRGLPVGTAAPTATERAAARHHLVEFLDIDQYYSAACFEQDAMALLPGIFERTASRTAVVAGGSMMYVDALCHGIDQLPTVEPEVRAAAYALLDAEGIEGVTRRLESVDPEFLRTTSDLRNAKRLVHALEVSIQAGCPYSSLITGTRRERPFRILKFAIDYPREELFGRINARVLRMVEQGLVDEARRMLPMRHLNALNTVGYKELFAHFDGLMDLDTAIARIQKNTRVYAKKQLTWLRRDPEVVWLSPSEPLLPQVMALIHPI